MIEFIIGLGIGVLGILVTLWVAYIQGGSPEIKVVCNLISGGDPCGIECIVSNSGKKEARDIYVEFNRSLPLNTVVYSEPETGIRLLEVELPPDPVLYPQESSLLKAFSVHIPRITSKDSIKFQIRSTDPDNIRAGEQIMRIRQIKHNAIRLLGERLAKCHPEEVKRWDLGLILSANDKKENIFSPGQFSYESGRYAILFLTEAETLASTINQDLYARYKAEFIDIYANDHVFTAPVVRIKTAHGPSTYGIMPAYVKSQLFTTGIKKELIKNMHMTLYPDVPKIYY